MDDKTINSHSRTEENPEKNDSTNTMAFIYLLMVLTLALLNCHTGNPSPIPTNTEKPNNHEQLLIIIEMLKTMNCTEADAKFYSPQGNEKGIKEALQCCSYELGTVREECFVDNKNASKLVNKAIMLIRRRLVLSNYTLKADEKIICEYKERGYTGFLDNIQTLVEKLNSS